MVEQQELEEMIEKLNTLEFCDDQDTVVWKLESCRKFSARSLYRFISLGGVVKSWFEGYLAD